MGIIYMDFSIVVPVLNEEESLRELVTKINRAFLRIKKTYEIIFVDDGSNDDSLKVLKSLKHENNQIRIFSFRRNMGKSHALMLGFEKANGKYVITLDADLQDDPENIMSLYRKASRDGFDLVTGWRKNRRDKQFKTISSKLFNSLVSFLFDTKLNDLNSGLKLFSQELAKDLKIYGGMHRFIPIIAREMGYSVTEVETTHHARKYGTSKYKFSKIFTDIPDLFTMYFLTKYDKRPLHFFGKFGGIILILGSIILFYLLNLRLLGEKIGDRPLLIFGVLLVLAGIQTIFTGLIADLLVNFNSHNNNIYSLKYDSDK